MQSERTGQRNIWVWLLGGVVVVLFIVLTLLSEKARSNGGVGILAFEFVGSPERAAKFMVQWNDDARRAIEQSLWLDYVFMIAYATWFSVLVGRSVGPLREAGRESLARIGDELRRAPVAAAGFDALENAALLLIVNGTSGDNAPVVATIAASVKFALLAAVFGYLVAAAWISRNDVPRSGSSVEATEAKRR